PRPPFPPSSPTPGPRVPWSSRAQTRWTASGPGSSPASLRRSWRPSSSLMLCSSLRLASGWLRATWLGDKLRVRLLRRRRSS
ncbi:hypothetical protein KEM55_006630, partial [Ascosphaera atra]